MVRVNGDFVPFASGQAHLGVDGGPNAGAFDFSTISPFGHVHLESGVWHHATSTGWESGVIRFNSAAACFEASVDGGITFACIDTGGAGAVSSVGAVGGADLTGNIDIGASSGFIVVGDTAGASPITVDLDVWALSGLWGFPTNGFVNTPQCYSEVFTSTTSLVVSHNLNSQDVVVGVYDNSSPPRVLFPDDIELTNANSVTVTFNIATAGRVVVIAC